MLRGQLGLQQALDRCLFLVFELPPSKRDCGVRFCHLFAFCQAITSMSTDAQHTVSNNGGQRALAPQTRLERAAPWHSPKRPILSLSLNWFFLAPVVSAACFLFVLGTGIYYASIILTRDLTMQDPQSSPQYSFYGAGHFSHVFGLIYPLRPMENVRLLTCYLSSLPLAGNWRSAIVWASLFQNCFSLLLELFCVLFQCLCGNAVLSIV